MNPTHLCPKCQNPLPANAPEGLCPQCLLMAAAGSQPGGDIIDIGDPAEVAKKLPQFEILELLGRGGMGVVYKARQLQLDRLVALKILPPLDALSADFVARFTREARALARLNHPNIVNVHDFGETDGLYYIIMEYVDGANLRQLLQSQKLTPAEALAIVPRICDALEYAHEEGLVHRDIKPENLLIDKKGRVKIADFGLAKLLRREPLDMTLTHSGVSLGTLRYMAPEQMDKPETVDHRADLYSLGVVIYEMLTGETPVGRFELPSQKASVDIRLDKIVLHALERDVERRYQHASEIKTDVEDVAAKTASPASPAAAAPEEPPSAPGEWLIQCVGCGHTKPLAAVGGIRTGGASVGKRFLINCSKCGGGLGTFVRAGAVQKSSPVKGDGLPVVAPRPPRRHWLTALLTVFSLAAFIFGVNFRSKMEMTPAGRQSLTVVGTVDPVFVHTSHPMGFHQHINIFSWSFLSIVVGGVAFAALWRISREDEGKVARDPAWWLDWWKQVGIWCGLLLLACTIRTVLNPKAVFQPPEYQVKSTPAPVPVPSPN